MKSKISCWRFVRSLPMSMRAPGRLGGLIDWCEHVFAQGTIARRTDSTARQQGYTRRRPRADGGIGRRARLRAWSGITGWRFESPQPLANGRNPSQSPGCGCVSIAWNNRGTTVRICSTTSNTDNPQLKPTHENQMQHAPTRQRDHARRPQQHPQRSPLTEAATWGSQRPARQKPRRATPGARGAPSRGPRRGGPRAARGGEGPGDLLVRDQATHAAMASSSAERVGTSSTRRGYTMQDCGAQSQVEARGGRSAAARSRSRRGLERFGRSRSPSASPTSPRAATRTWRPTGGCDLLPFFDRIDSPKADERPVREWLTRMVALTASTDPRSELRPRRPTARSWLSAALGEAVRKKLLPSNPCEWVKLPVEKVEIDYLSSGRSTATSRPAGLPPSARRVSDRNRRANLGGDPGALGRP